MKIAPYAPDSAWTSQTVKAVITPNLCVPVLFGLPFLSINCIVTDFKDHTAIDKMCGYDLLNPPAHKTRKKLVNTKLAISNTKENKKLMLAELIKGKMVPEAITPLDVAGMIKEHVETLCFQEKVGNLENQMLIEFADVFQPLPHVERLP